MSEDVQWAGEMTQWVKVLAAKPDDLSSIPGTLTMTERTDLLWAVLYFMTVDAHTHRHNKLTSVNKDIHCAQGSMLL